MKKKVEVQGFYEKRFRLFEGRMLTQIEALGLPEGQQEALKSIFRNELWYMWNHAPFSEEKTLEFGETNPY
jgi:hypothetical protein